MLFMLINRSRTGLTEQDTKTLHEMTAEFYRNIPADFRFVGEYNTVDWTRNFTILETSSLQAIHTLMAPFAKYVDMEVVQIQPTAYFAKLTQG